MLLEIENLRTHFETGQGVVRAVDGISLSIEKGETFCLVGESGSGKSVTALSILRLLPQSISSHPTGRILFQYRGPDGKQETLDLLRLPEDSLRPVFTVGDQIIEALLLHHPQMSWEQARQRAIQALEEVQIPDPAGRMEEYPHRLSGGQRQRVMIAMAMACEPDLLIADEPTTALDVTIQKEILQLMQELQQKNNMAILFITHDFGVVSQIAHHLAVMYRGRIVESGTLEEVLQQPKDRYTRHLLAALPENLKRNRRRWQRSVENPAAEKENEPLVELHALKVYFPIKRGVLKHTVGHVKAVDSVSLEIPRGQILALVGESGCGKTTLGRAILRLIEPTAGRVHFGGREITGLPRRALRPFRRQLQIIFQDPISSLNPRLTVATILTEPMAVHQIGESREQRLEIAARVLQQVQLSPDHLWRFPHEFSGGQRQRIGIARALALNPAFIVCDEVTSALDVSVQAEILQILLDLREKHGLTLLFITHDIAVVEYISDETAVMYQGRIVERGPTDKVCGNPDHPYTRKLLAAVPRVKVA